MLRDKFVNSILKERQPSLVAYSTFPIAILHFRFVELVIDRIFDKEWLIVKPIKIMSAKIQIAKLHI